MAGINRAILIGNLGADPETRFTHAGSPVTNFRIATSESWKDKQTGQKQERTEWHSIVAFGRRAEIAGEYLRKGSKVFVEGALRTSSWESDGQTRYKTEIIVSELQMLDGKPAGGDQQRPAQQQAPRMQPAPQQSVDDFDDDIPF
jgi:single-strand DNA-binding protein